MSKLYLKNGYLNIAYIIDRARREHTPFVYIVGGRGTGKTYGALKYLYEQHDPFLYLRHSQRQMDIIMRPEMQPFAQINHDCGYKVRPFPITTGLAAFYNAVLDDSDKWQPDGDPVGMIAALSTFSNLRGFDAQRYKVLLYDEFIPEQHERKIKDEPGAFYNAYETINRNRELSGGDPLLSICLSNANDLTNDYFVDLQIVGKAAMLQESGAEILTLPERGIALYILAHSPISEAKSTTALYRLTKGSAFYDMSINNDFVLGHGARIESRPLSEYRAIVSVGEIVIYRHKARQEFYCTTHLSGKCTQLSAGYEDLERFTKRYFYIWQQYLVDHIIFESYLCESLFVRYFK